MFLLVLSFSLDNEKERALDSIGVKKFSWWTPRHLTKSNKIKQQGKQENDLRGSGVAKNLCLMRWN
jgi:hypothetical protein